MLITCLACGELVGVDDAHDCESVAALCAIGILVPDAAEDAVGWMPEPVRSFPDERGAPAAPPSFPHRHLHSGAALTFVELAQAALVVATIAELLDPVRGPRVAKLIEESGRGFASVFRAATR